VTHAWERGGRGNRLGVEPGDTENGETCRRIPPGQVRFEGAAVVTPDVKPVFATERSNHRQHDVGRVDKAAGGTPAALHLDHGWCGEGNGVGEGARESGQEFAGHARIVAHACAERIPRTGSETRDVIDA
jgi:hypothetical protein